MTLIELLKSENGKDYSGWIKEQETFLKGYRQALIDKDDFTDSVKIEKLNYVLRILKFAIPSDDDYMSDYAYKLTDADYALIVETGKGIIDGNAKVRSEEDETPVSHSISWNDLVAQEEGLNVD